MASRCPMQPIRSWLAARADVLPLWLIEPEAGPDWPSGQEADRQRPPGETPALLRGRIRAGFGKARRRRVNMRVLPRVSACVPGLSRGASSRRSAVNRNIIRHHVRRPQPRSE
ncbi:hypothetical protein BLAT2472_110029 [Burkholderia latens]